MIGRQWDLNLQHLVREPVPFSALQDSSRVLKPLSTIRLSNPLLASSPGSVVGFYQGSASLSFAFGTVSPVPVLMPVDS